MAEQLKRHAICGARRPGDDPATPPHADDSYSGGAGIFSKM